MKEINTYLNFDGNCDAAMTFYSNCLGAELQMSTMGNSQPNVPENAKDRIMHARILKGGTILLMASDTMPGMPFLAGTNFSISIQCESSTEVDSVFAALAEGGETTMAPADAFWGARFGMLKDKFGIHWMLNYEFPKSA
ncbi:MAG: VOC family protein [Acidobacteriota bacterium]